MYLQYHHQTLSFLAQCNQFDNRAIEHYNSLKRLVTTWYQSTLTLGPEKAKGLPELFIFGNPGSIPIVSEVKQNDHLDQKKQAWPKPWSTTCMTKICQLWKQHSGHNLTPHIVQASRSTEQDHTTKKNPKQRSTALQLITRSVLQDYYCSPGHWRTKS